MIILPILFYTDEYDTIGQMYQCLFILGLNTLKNIMLIVKAMYTKPLHHMQLGQKRWLEFQSRMKLQKTMAGPDCH